MKRLSLQTLAEILQQEGWDVVVGEDVIARREGATGVWMLYADTAGRIRLEATRNVGLPQARRFHLEGREYRVLREEQEVVNILTTIEEEDELVEVLHTLEDMLVRRLWEEE